MIIPIKCVTCGMVLADKYRYFIEKSREIKLQKGIHPDRVLYLDKENRDKAPEGQVLDDLRLKNMCCRRTMLTHVDIE
jgi:DNA-directed RNA polymerase subunit N (RpoN/RPB10)